MMDGIRKRIRIELCFLWILICLAGVSVTASAESADENHYETWLQTIYTRDNGLSAGEANDVAATSDGLIWVGTYAGLYRYNGSEFQLMSEYDSVKNVNCLYVDEEDRLWVGTNDNGISVFQDEELLATLTMEQGLPSDSVRSIVRNSDGNYYVGTSDSLAVVTFEDSLAVKDTVTDIKYADKIAADDKGNVIAISSYGTMFLLKEEKIVGTKNLSDEDRFTSCVFDDSGNVRVGSSLGYVYVYQLQDNLLKKTAKYECSEIGKVNNLISVDENTIFVCADNGIGYFDEDSTFHNLKTQNFTSSIYNVILDYQGNLWFASSRMGLLKLCDTNFTELFTEYSIPASVVNTIERFEKNLYVGTDTGLIIIDEEDHKVISNALTDQFDGIRIRQIYKDSKNNLWFCTFGSGLIQYDGKDTITYDPNNENIGIRVRTMIELSTGELVISSENGISFLKDGKIEKTITEKDGLVNQINLCLLEMPDGTIFSASDGSGIIQIKDYQVTGRIGKEEGLPSEVILKLVADTQGDGIFIITSNALCYRSADGEIQILDNFPYSNCYDLVEQDDSVFVMSSAGIYAVLRDELLANEEGMNYTFLDSKSGLLNALVANSWLLQEQEDEKLYLATSSGVSLFDLKAYDERPVDFKVQIASVTVDGEKIKPEDEEYFSFSQKVNRLEIKPEIINYSTVDPLISCYLEGFDKAPIIMPQSDLSMIVYTNLPAGKYTFHMSLVDSESGVSISERVYHIEKENAFTDTVWFYVLIIAAIIIVATWIGIFILRKMYNKRISAKEQELEKAWHRSMTDGLTGLKNRFALQYEITGYVGKNITVIMLDIDYFKLYNDTYGHQIGDQVLRKVGEILLKYYNEEERSAYRFGGDEFLLIDRSVEETYILKRLHDVEKEIADIRIEGCEQTIHISYGYQSGILKSENDMRQFGEDADQKLYEAKNNRA